MFLLKEAGCFLNRFSYLYYVAIVMRVVYLQVKLDRCLFHKQMGFWLLNKTEGLFTCNGFRRCPFFTPLLLSIVPTVTV